MMPLLSSLNHESRSQSSQSNRTTVRYCDVLNGRHQSHGSTICSYASPQIAALVPEEQRHRRVRSGVDSSHFSFTAAQSASHLLRLSKRFESIDNDRSENMVDILNDISNKLKDSSSMMQRIVAQVDTEGTVCTLLKQICDAFRASLISESPQMEAVARNTAYIMDYGANQAMELNKLCAELSGYRLDHLRILETGFDKLFDDTRQMAQNSTEGLMEGKELKEKMEVCATEISSLKCELQMTNSVVERFDANTQMSSVEMKQQLVDIKHEITKLGAEMQSIRDAIVDIMPIKLMEVLNAYNSELSSQLGSDLEVIDSTQGEGLANADSPTEEVETVRARTLSEESKDSEIAYIKE